MAVHIFSDTSWVVFFMLSIIEVNTTGGSRFMRIELLLSLSNKLLYTQVQGDNSSALQQQRYPVNFIRDPDKSPFGHFSVHEICTSGQFSIRSVAGPNNSPFMC